MYQGWSPDLASIYSVTFPTESVVYLPFISNTVAGPWRNKPLFPINLQREPQTYILFQYQYTMFILKSQWLMLQKV